MPKGRHLKPDFFTDKNIVAMAPLARILYQGLWCYAADCGHLDDEPVELKMRILPADNCDVDALLDEIAWHKRIERKDGVIYLPKLRDHGRIDKRYETVCDDCKEAAKHDGTTPSEPPQETPITTGPQREHDVVAQGPRRDHEGDGDGDGDGDVMVMSPPKGGKRATQLPGSWQPNEAHRKIAEEERRDLAREVTLFRDDCAMKGRTTKDWDAAFRNWLRSNFGFRRQGATARLPRASEIEQPPNGLTDEQYDQWLRERA